LNLLVIISISHFRQLHTTTNILLLSLAVADFLVGLVQMPAEMLLFQGCWILGEIMCAFMYFLGPIPICASVGNMVLISADRYIAICDPMFYSTKVTLRRVQFCVSACWIGATMYNVWTLRNSVEDPERFSTCYGECIYLVNFVEGVLDIILSFFAPILVIIVLYVRIFVVAVSQARAMRSHVAAAAQQRSKTVTPKKSEMKAARTLGVVVVVFLLCFCPYYCFTIAGENVMLTAYNAVFQVWLLYFNSCLNPVIYVFLYPWFRKSIKQIVTFQILKPGSSDTNIL
ncbi:trace amine-associated receptor 13c-like, partial [Plectropomus leopardus]|uniref:trace amine-associated receptor 13c-like n=1 Tax=Plectropomus leopardus TaxID=160734 RepID=UPI001C4AA28F